MKVTAEVSPSLALIKYWGKVSGQTNIPATSSLAVTLGALKTRTTISGAVPLETGRDTTAGDDSVFIDGVAQERGPYLPVVEAVWRAGESTLPARAREPVRIESLNDFPTAAGLASSSSGFAALSVALDAYFGTSLSTQRMSAIARIGSGSASRAVYGGFTEWKAGEESAAPLAPETHWPELRVLIVVIKSSRKPVSSRSAMERARLTSPYYQGWVESSPALFERARQAILARDLDELGPLMRQSYLRMFSTMFTSDPPVVYWLPESLAVIRKCEALRADGLAVWETMDAGPQVKLITVDSTRHQVIDAIHQAVPEAEIISSRVGGGPVVRSMENQ